MLCAVDGSRRFLPPGWAVAMRFLIFGLVLLVAVVTFSVLGSFESILGAACSISSSMLLPALFFYRWAGLKVTVVACADNDGQSTMRPSCAGPAGYIGMNSAGDASWQWLCYLVLV